MENKKLFTEFEPVSKQQWIDKATADLKGKPLNKLQWQLIDEIGLDAYYNAEDIANNITATKSIPGSYPFIKSSKVLSNGWLVRERISASSIKKAKAKINNSIQQGVHNIALSINVDQQGIDGIPIKNSEQLAQVLADIDPNATGISLDVSNSSPFYLRLLSNWIQEHGHQSKSIFGALNFDPLTDFLKTGSYYNEEGKVLDDLSKCFSLAKAELPFYKVLTVHSSVFHNAGATTVQELAYTLALANEYITILLDKGHSIESICTQMQVQLSIGTHYFVEIAKQRAFRWLWSTLLSVYTDNKSAAIAPYLVSQTSEWDKTIFDPYVNMLRSTTQAMSAAIAGADEIQIDAYDKAFKTPTEFSERIARNLHHLLAGESHLDQVIDPSSGAYYIEHLTQELAQAAWAKFKAIEAEGGLLASAKKGKLQSELKKIKALREDRVATRKDIFIGVNQYPNPKDSITELLQESADPKQFNEDDAKEEGNVKAFIDKEWSTSNINIDPIESFVATDVFDQIRAMAQIMEQEGTSLPSIFLWSVGNKAMRAARAGFAQNLFECAGLKVHANIGFDSAKDAFDAYEKNKDQIVVFCAADEEYLNIIPQATKYLKKYKPSLILAGKAGEHLDDFEMMGIEDYIYNGMNIVQFLQQFVPDAKNMSEQGLF